MSGTGMTCTAARLIPCQPLKEMRMKNMGFTSVLYIVSYGKVEYMTIRIFLKASH